MEINEKRSCDCDCDCSCDDVGCSEDNLPERILGSINHDLSFWHSSVDKIKWVFVEEEGDERQIAD